MAWGVDIEPVIAMVSAAFGKYLCFFFFTVCRPISSVNKILAGKARRLESPILAQPVESYRMRAA